jgi:hypothetical protein
MVISLAVVASAPAADAACEVIVTAAGPAPEQPAVKAIRVKINIKVIILLDIGGACRLLYSVYVRRHLASRGKFYNKVGKIIHFYKCDVGMYLKDFAT